MPSVRISQKIERMKKDMHQALDKGFVYRACVRYGELLEIMLIATVLHFPQESLMRR
jgi:hypothetical protein